MPLTSDDLSENHSINCQKKKSSTIILGVDPGSRITGFGVIKVVGHNFQYVASGCIRTKAEDFPDRLKEIYLGLDEVIATYQPDMAAIEQVFVKINVGGALKLGQARGAAICACVVRGLKVDEYSANQVKKAVVGRGHATKEQVQHMVVAHLQLNKAPQEDAADALAIAMCHAQTYRTLSRYAASSAEEKASMSRVKI